MKRRRATGRGMAILSLRASAKGEPSASCSFYPIQGKSFFLGCLATFSDMTEKGLLPELSKTDLSTIGSCRVDGP